MGLSTHVLDTAGGAPAAGVPVALEHRPPGSPGAAAADWRPRARATTDADGRAVLLEGELPAGSYRLVFDVAALAPFFGEVAVAMALAEPAQRLHVPLLLSPYGYTTYRGS